MGLINRLLPVKMLERVFHLNPRKRRRMRHEEEEMIQQRRRGEEGRIQQRMEHGDRIRQKREEEERIQQRKLVEEERIQPKREEDERIQQKREEEERIQQKREEEERIQQKRDEEERIQHNREEEERIQQMREEEEKIQQKREEEERIQHNREEEEKIQQKRGDEERIQQKREEEERIQQKMNKHRYIQQKSLRDIYKHRYIQQKREEAGEIIRERREDEEMKIQQIIENKIRAEILEEERGMTEAVEDSTMISIDALPAELLEKVFHLLPPRDLKAVVLVCRWWREVGEAPALWVWVWVRQFRRIRRNRFCRGETVSIDIPEVLDSSRLQAVRRVGVAQVSEELLQAVVRHPGLRVMQVQYSNLSSVDHLSGLLAQAVTKMEEAVLLTYTTPQQVTAICNAMTGSYRLKTLDLSYNDLSSVDANILAQAVTKLEEVGLRETKMTHKQKKAIFAALDTTSHLKILRIGDTSLSCVDPDVLARVANKLETVSMRYTNLTEQQMTRILTQSLLTTNLKELSMWGNNGGVEEALLRHAEKVITQLFVQYYPIEPLLTYKPIDQ